MTNFAQNDLNIYDLWLIFAKHRRLFWTVFAVVMLVGIVIILLKHQHYIYTQNIKIAGYFNNDQNVTFQKPDTVISMITTTYLPKVLAQYNSQHSSHPVYLGKNNLSVTNTGEVINLTTQGTMEKQQIYAELFRGILVQLIKDVDPQVQITRNYLTNQLANLEKQLAVQIGLNKNLATKLGAQNTLLMQFIVNNQNDKTAESIAHIGDIRYELATLQNSHFASDLVRSVTPVGMSKMALMILVIIMSVILSFLTIFMIECREKIRLLYKMNRDELKK
jgi:hypothetical protein